MTAITSKLMPVKSVHRKTLPDEQHLFLTAVSWESYIAIGNALADRPALRITYDRGNLEFMTTSREHEFYKKWLDQFINTLAEELNRPIEPGGNMTFQRADLQRALEGDECYWIEHEPEMRRKTTWDPDVDPPPDLVLEIEISRSVLDRLAILAALKVPEVWAFDGTAIRVYRLQPDGTYQAIEKSRIFPEIPLDEMARFLIADEKMDYLTAKREFRNWVRKLLGKPPIS